MLDRPIELSPIVEVENKRVTAGLAQLANPAASLGDPHFRCLGVDGTTCFFQPFNVAQVIELTASQLKRPHVFRLAPLQWWEVMWPQQKGGCDWDAAINALVRASVACGAYERGRLTGRGTYIVPGSMDVVSHMGDHLLVGEEVRNLTEHNSDRIYIASASMDVPKLPRLATSQSQRFDKLCGMLDWKSPEMAKLFAGWCVIAPVCGALKWRPHVWINGPFESGKSFVLKEIAGQFLDGLSLSFGGSITEAGIRQALSNDALPVLIDEAEAKDERASHRLDAILELARSSSQPGGAAISKGGAAGKATHYRVQSAFAFASIDVGVKQTADESRIVRLTLRGPDASADSAERGRDFAAIKLELSRLVRENYGPRLFHRTRHLLLTITENASDFGAVIAARTGSGRMGDVLGPLVAGWYSLHSEGRVLPHEAERLLSEWEWLGTALTRNKTMRDYEAALAHLLEAQISLDHGVRRTVAEMLTSIRNSDALAVQCDEALRRHGLRYEIANRSQKLFLCRNAGAIKAIFHGTQWSASPVDTIGQNPRTSITKQPVRFGGGIRQRAVEVDLIAEGYGDE